MVIVRAQPPASPGSDRIFDLRVEDSDDPLSELRAPAPPAPRYNLEDQGDNFIAEKKPAQALVAYEAAARLAPEIVELQFWAAVSMYTNDRKPEALEAVPAGVREGAGLGRAREALAEGRAVPRRSQADRGSHAAQAARQAEPVDAGALSLEATA